MLPIKSIGDVCMRKPGWRKWPFLLALYGAATCSLFIHPAPAIAQTATGEMTITVTDSSGAAVPGAQVKIIGTDTGASVRSLSSNASGLADIPLLQPGRYTTIITAPGFKVFTRSAVSVSVGNIVDLHIALQVGANSQSVVVTGDAPLVEDKSEVIAQVIQSKQLLSLPLNGRNYLDAANLSPGVVPTAAGRDNTFSAFGNSGLQNSFLLDGTRNVN